MAGITNSWIEQYTVQPTPCILDTNTNAGAGGTLSSCIVWVIIAFVFSQVRFEKKGSQQ